LESRRERLEREGIPFATVLAALINEEQPISLGWTWKEYLKIRFQHALKGEVRPQTMVRKDGSWGQTSEFDF